LAAEKHPAIFPTRTNNQRHKTPRKNQKIKMAGNG
jgi:hypothetical protein